MFKKISLFIVTFMVFFSFLNIDIQAKDQTIKENPTFLITFKESVDKQLIVQSGGDILVEYEPLPIVKVKMPTDLVNKLALNESIESIEKDKNISINKGLKDESRVKIPKQIIPWGVKSVNKKYTKTDVLNLDEWLLTDLSKDEANILLENTEARHKNSSTIYCSQIDPRSKWIALKTREWNYCRSYSRSYCA